MDITQRASRLCVDYRFIPKESIYAVVNGHLSTENALLHHLYGPSNNAKAPFRTYREGGQHVESEILIKSKEKYREGTIVYTAETTVVSLVFCFASYQK